MKRIIWPEKLAKAGYATVALGMGMIFVDNLLCSNIPTTYRSTILDVVDYIAGKNIFHRKESLQ